jgi:hypothetical protein
MQIRLRATGPGGQPYPPKKGGPGFRVIWSDDLQLAPSGPPAGTHSGIGTTLRDVVAGDPYVPVPGGGGAELIQYEVRTA